MMLEYEGFHEMLLDKSNTTIKLIDDCGNRWDCYQVYQSLPEKLFKIGVDGRRSKNQAPCIHEAWCSNSQKQHDFLH